MILIKTHISQVSFCSSTTTTFEMMSRNSIKLHLPLLRPWENQPTLAPQRHQDLIQSQNTTETSLIGVSTKKNRKSEKISQWKCWLIGHIISSTKTTNIQTVLFIRIIKRFTCALNTGKNLVYTQWAHECMSQLCLCMETFQLDA